MEFRQIRYFVAVAEAGSFLGAASELHISQPALSKAVRALEDSLQVRLLERGARRVTLTTYGRRFYDYGKAVLAELAHASAELQTMRSLPGGSITIGSLRTVANMILPRVTTAFIRRFPEVRLRIVENYNADLIQGLERGEFDFIIGIVEGHLSERGYRYEPLFHDRLSVIARKGHTLARRKKVDAASLARFPWILPPTETLIRRRIEEMFYSAGVAPPLPMVESGSLQYIRAMVAESDCLAMIPQHSVRFDCELDLLTILPISSEFMRRPIGLIMHPHHVLPSLALPLIEEIRAAISSYSSEEA